jgi:hypothetical protein
MKGGPVIATRTHAGRRYLVLKATLLRVGRFTGSQGPINYSAALLKESASGWNGKPVTVGHPLNRDGRPVPAGSRAGVEGAVIGHLAGVRFDEASGRLQGELWVDENLASRLASGLYHAIRSKRPVDVSTGLELFLDAAGRPLRIAPDHLAILKDGVGACSSGHGCGVGV